MKNVIRRFALIFAFFWGFWSLGMSQQSFIEENLVGTWQLCSIKYLNGSDFTLEPINVWKVIFDNKSFVQIRTFKDAGRLRSQEGTYKLDNGFFIENIDRHLTNKSMIGKTNIFPFRFINENTVLFNFSNKSDVGTEEFWIRVNELDWSTVHTAENY